VVDSCLHWVYELIICLLGIPPVSPLLLNGFTLISKFSNHCVFDSDFVLTFKFSNLVYLGA
jgi:hypothetical protein